MRHRWLPGRFAVLAVVAVALLAVHGIVLRYVSTGLALPAIAVLGVVAFVLLKHLGMLGALLAAVRSHVRSRRPRQEDDRARSEP